MQALVDKVVRFLQSFRARPISPAMGDEMKFNALLRCGRRCAHVAFTDGKKLYVWGGYYMMESGVMARQRRDQLWTYISSLDFWHCEDCSGQVPPGASGARCEVVLPYVYLIGGHVSLKGHCNQVHRLHLRSFVWELVTVSDGPVMTPRDKFTSWVYDDKIYCFGGFGPPPYSKESLDEDGRFVENYSEYSQDLFWNNQVISFDTSTFTWENPVCRGPKPSPRAAHAAVLLGSEVYVFGGRHNQTRMNDLHRLDLATLTWSGDLQPKCPDGEPVGRSWHTFSAINQEEIFLFGGYDQQQNVLGDAWILNVSSLTWRPVLRQSPHGRLWHTAVVTDNSEVLIFGGCTKDINSRTTEEDHSDMVIRFRLQPKSLVSACLECIAITSDRNKTWGELPQYFVKWLMKRQQRIQQFRWSETKVLNVIDALHVSKASPTAAGDEGSSVDAL